jgi:hypothetical protein
LPGSPDTEDVDHDLPLEVDQPAELVGMQIPERSRTRGDPMAEVDGNPLIAANDLLSRVETPVEQSLESYRRSRTSPHGGSTW